MHCQSFVACGCEAWYAHLAQTCVSSHTLKNYQRDLTQLHVLLDEAAAVFPDTPMSRLQLIWCLKRLSQRGLHPRTLARKLSVWRQYNRFLLEKNYCDEDHTANLKPPKAPQRLPKALGAEALNHLLDAGAAAAGEEDSILLRRNQAIFELMYGSGLRLAEVQGLNMADIRLNDGWVSVLGKGGKMRHVPLGSKSIAALNIWLAVRNAKDGETALFVGKTGTRLSTRRIQQCLNEWAQLQGASQHLSPHMLRHSFASHLLQSSHNIRAVQELLGHSQLSTTQIYTKLDFDHLAQVYDAAHPRAKKKTQD